MSFGSFFIEFCAKFDRPTLFESTRRDMVAKQGSTKSAIPIRLILAVDWPLVRYEDKGPPTSPNRLEQAATSRRAAKKYISWFLGHTLY